MKIYDISQEVFSCKVFPGDPIPEKTVVNSIGNGGLYNLTKFSMCAHNGTHIDAPYHFINDGKTVDNLSLDKTVGYAFVTTQNGVITGEKASQIISKAKSVNLDASKRILIKGNAVVSNDASEVFAKELYLIGVESQTVGEETAPMQAHLNLLSKEVVLLEGLRLSSVSDGVYLLASQPLNLGGADGAPCRAILIEL